MIRRACVDGIGVMDERFFMYCEEVDWALRARKAGWRSYFLPQAKVIHVGAASTSLHACLMDDIHAQSDYRYYAKHFGLKGGLLVRLGDLIGAGLALLLSGCALICRRSRMGNLPAAEELAASWHLLRRALAIKSIRPKE